MYHSEDIDAVPVMPSIPPARTTERQHFTEGNPRMGQNATVWGADIANTVVNELLNLVEGAGIKPEKQKLTQVLEAVQRIADTAGGIRPWSETSTYDPLPHIVWGSDNMIYIAEQPSGPGVAGVGAKDPTTTTGYWKSLAQFISGGSSGGGSGDLVYPGAIQPFFRSRPPANWRVANGQLITSVDIVVPQLCAALQTEDMADLLTDEATWQSMSAAAGGIGGVPRFVLDAGANTIRLPDIRGDYMEFAGFDGLAVAGWHQDAIRNIPGTFTLDAQSHNTSGAFTKIEVGASAIDTDVLYTGDQIVFSPDRVVPTANKNQPRAFGVLGCVYVGPPAS